tara:strand:- start:838 stop:1350 length:513 start_codon:yes stop_codon:yes gene_type:complete
MMKVKFLVLIVLVALINSCSEGEKYVYGEKIYIKYAQPITNGEWIKIDGKTFYHTQADTTGQMMNPEFQNDIYHPDTLKKYEDGVILPATVGFSALQGQNIWVEIEFEKGQLASALFASIPDVLEDGKQYKAESNLYQMANGEILLTRKDGKKIKVSTSEGYGAYIEKRK